MKSRKKFRLSALCAVLFASFALLCAADDASPYADIYPASDTGAYRYTYEEASPGASYLIFMLAGTYEESDTPTLSPDNGSILYYNHVRADKDGKIDLSFVPMLYQDGTVFLSSGTLKAPKLLFYAKAGDAKDVADFEIQLNADEYVIKGSGVVTYVRYTVTAKDSFGFASRLPSYAKREMVGYDGDKIEISPSGNALLLDSSLEEGTYTFAITCGNITRTASFKVKHDTSVPTRMTVMVDGNTFSTNYIEADTGLDSTTFNPEYLPIEVQTLDQFGSPMEDSYTYTYVGVKNGVSGKPQQIVGSGASQKFYPPEIPDIDEQLEYKLTVTSSKTDPSSDRGQPFSYTTTIIVVGGTSFTGKAQSLFETYLNANSYLTQLDENDILIADSSVNVPQNKMWTTQKNADELRAEVELAKVLLALHKTTPQSDSDLNERNRDLSKAVVSFKSSLLKGSYAVIEKLVFNSPTQSIPLGETQTFAVTATPRRPSEKILYTSENAEIATVDNNGEVRALAVGVTRITASNTDGTISAYYDLTVYRPITSLSFEPNKIALVAGERATPVCMVKPLDHTDTVTYECSDTKIVRVDAQTGDLLALSEGTAVITARTLNGVKTTLTVTVTTPTFSGTQNARAKHASEIKFTYAINKAFHFKSMSVTATFDPAIFTLKNTESKKFADSYTGTNTEEAGKAISSWEFADPMQTTSATEFVTYTFAVSEDAPYAKYNITFVLQANTPNGSSVLADSFEQKAVVTVGESSAYTVKAVASGSGKVSGGGSFELGEQVTLTASPDKNYSLSGWYIGNKLVYSGLKYTFTVTEDVTVTAKFVKNTPSGGGTGGGGTGGGGTTGGGTGGIVKLEQVKPVTCDTPSGLITPGTKVTLSCATVGAVIYYTLDGNPPTGTSLRYSEPIEITQNGTQIRAVAIKNGMTNSEIVAFNFRFPEEPVKEPDEPVGNAVITLKQNASQIKYLAANSSYIRPNDPASRYEVVEMLAKLFDITGVTPTNRFSDVSGSYKDVVGLFSAAGIINGYEDGTFGGAREITRAELVKILSLLLGLDKTAVEGETAVSLSDIPGHWAESNIRKFVAKGYILGYPEGDFRPDKAVTRAEAVTIINRVTGLVKTSGLAQRFRDLAPDFWAYDEIMNAAEA